LFHHARSLPRRPGFSAALLNELDGDYTRQSYDMSRRQSLTLVAATLGSAVAMIDGTIVNVALPAIERDLGGGLIAQQWVSNAYLLTLASLILLGGSLGDIYGERRVFAAGVTAFGVLSLACSLSPTIGVLIAARACQGAAAALVTPSSLAIIVAAFAPGERGAAIGSWTAWGGIAAIVGPLAGGGIVDRLSWRWIFALNVPLVIGTLVLILAAVPQGRHVARRRVDVIGAGLCALGLGGIVFALIEQPRYGWGSPLILVPLAAGLACFASFLVYERWTAEPMLKLELFSRRNFTVANLETLGMYAGLAILFFYLTIYLQQVAGYSALESGLTTLPVTLVTFSLSRRFGALADRRGPRLFMGAGPLIAAAGILLLARLGEQVSYVTDLLPGLLVFALGLSLTVAPLTATVLADADENDAGIASAVNNAVARVAGLIGISVVGIVVAEMLVGDTFAANSESVSAFRDVMLICAGLLAAAGVTGAAGIVSPRRPVSAERCPGGPLIGAPEPAVETRLPTAGSARSANA
jgi:EmrB/QacA subfamily drug resistance transporter